MAENKKKRKFPVKYLIGICTILALSISLIIGYVNAERVIDDSSYTLVGQEDGIGNYNVNNPLYIYNFQHYTDESGAVTVGGGFGYVLSGTNTGTFNVYIGDYENTSDSNTHVQPYDINLSMRNLSLENGEIIVNKVYNGGHVVNLTSTLGTSSVGTLRVLDGAILNLYAQSELNIDNLILEGASTINIVVNDSKNININNTSGTGTMNINEGAGTVTINNMNIGGLNTNKAKIVVNNSINAVESLTLNNTTLNSNNNAKVTSAGNISVIGGKISNLSLFGYDSDASGVKKITLSTNTELSNIEVFGIKGDSNAVASIIGTESISSINNVTFISDYTMSFYHDGVALDYNMDYYRAMYTDKNRIITGILGTVADGVFSTNTILPEYQEAGYEFSGWSINNSTDLYHNLVVNEQTVMHLANNVSLTTSVIAGEVEVLFDHGFIPDEYSHECTKPYFEGQPQYWLPDEEIIHVGDTITLNYPVSRLGYNFSGWLITTGSGTKTLSIERQTYTVLYEDLNEENGQKKLIIQALWEVEEYSYRLSFAGSSVPLENIEISFDGGKNWSSMALIEEIAARNDGITWEPTDKYLSFNVPMEYGMKFTDYFSSLNMGGYEFQIPLLRDNRDASVAEAFSNWRTINGTPLTLEHTFAYGGNGILDNKSSTEDLISYAESLQAKPFTFLPVWGTMSFTVTIPSVSGWDVLVNDVLQVPVNGIYNIEVLADSKVTFRVLSTRPNDYSNWCFNSNKTERIYLKEELYNPGDQYLNYTFFMPKSALTVQYSTPSDADSYYFDLYHSAITFEKGVEYNGIERNGFWYNYIADGYTPLFAMENGVYKSVSEITDSSAVTNYFYTWGSNIFRVTSNNQATTNQLTLVDELTIYLKNCNLIANNHFTNSVNYRTLNNIVLETTSQSIIQSNFNSERLAKYGNIVLNNETIDMYTTKFQIEGENTINSIVQSSFNISSNYQIPLFIHGDSKETSKLTLGSLLGLYKLNVKDIEIIGFENGLEYLFYITGSNEGIGAITVESSIIDAPTKRIFTSRGAINYSSSNVEIAGSFHYSTTNTSGNTNLLVHTDMIGHYNSVNMYGASNIRIKGDIAVIYLHWSAGGSINTDGALIVEGNKAVLTNFTITKGTIIANCLVGGNSFNIRGGKVITNQILNLPTKFPTVNSIGEWINNSAGSGQTISTNNVNGDDYPFITFTQDAAINGSYNIYENAQVYLFGYYKTNGKNYDGIVKAIDSDNPVSKWIQKYDNKETITEADLISDVNAQALQYETAPETFVIGISSASPETSTNGRIRNVHFYGNSKVYAAGNITLYNTTLVDGNAYIYANGSFKSKRDLTINGGTIYASEIGNAYDLMKTLNDNSKTWQKTTITAGNIFTDSLGSDDETRTTLVIVPGVNINPLTSDNQIRVVHDVCINYVYDDTYRVDGGTSLKYDNARTIGYWNDDFENMSLEGNQDKLFASVTLDDQPVGWAYGNLLGPIVTKIEANGLLIDKYVYLCNDEFSNIVLYAVKDKYNIIVKELNSSIVTYGGSNLYDGQTIEAVNQSQIVLSFDAFEQVNKTVLWYIDANGIYHNVMPEIDETIGLITFKMPASDVELYVTDTFTWDLSKGSINLTNKGFMVEKEESREDSKFDYQGNILITQSTTSAIVNQIVISDNTIFDRTISLEKIKQGLTSDYGIIISSGVEVIVKNIGSNATSAVFIPESASFTLEGEGSREENVLEMVYYSVGSDYFYFGTDDVSNQKVGNVTLRNVIINKAYNAAVIKSDVASPNTAIFDNVVVNGILYNTGALTTKLQEVKIINDCQINLVSKTSWIGTVFTNVNELYIENSTVSYTESGAMYGTDSIFYSVNYVNIHNSEVIYTTRRSTPGVNRYEDVRGEGPKEIKLTGTSILNYEDRMSFSKIVLKDNSVLNVTGQENTSGYLLCDNVEVYDNAILNSDYVIVSAFTRTNAGYSTGESDFINWAQTPSKRVNTGTFTMEGGTVNVNKFIGGAFGATLNIKGGELNAPAIGTHNAIFGHAGLIQPLPEDTVYQYVIKLRETSSVINIDGGTVNVLEDGYLGGYNSKVNVNTGTINLKENAVLGLTDQQTITAKNDASSQGIAFNDIVNVIININGGTVEGLEAKINVPYGTINVTDSSSAIKVYDMIAENGVINISDAQGAYDFVTSYEYETKAGVYVENLLSARLIDISQQAIVYANVAEANIPQGMKGGLVITSNAADTRLYANSYGAFGLGSDSTSVDVITSGSNQNIYSIIRIISIQYYLNDDEIDRAINHDNNTDSYAQYSLSENDYKLDLGEPERHGFKFDGWFEDADFTMPISAIDTTNANPVNLYAKWSAKTVVFNIILDSRVGISDIGTAISGKEGTYDSANDIFTYGLTYTLEYRSQLQGGSGIRLAEYDLNTHQVISLEIADSRYPSGLDKSVDTTTRVNAEIFDAYANGETPFILRVSAVQKTMVKIIFDLNLSGLLPLDAIFNAGSTDDATSTTVESWVDYGKLITTGSGFVVGSEFISATAPGYVFNGWMDIDGNLYENLKDLVITRSSFTHYYASWTAKTYVVEFNSNVSGGQVTHSKDVKPVATDSQSITGKVVYDGIINGNIIWEDTLKTLPVAWQNGYKFAYWEVDGIKLDVNTKFNLSTFANIEEEYGDSEDISLVVTAVYEQVQVTYHINDGIWQTDEFDGIVSKSNTPTVSAVWGEPLAGMVKNTTASADYDVYSEYEVNGIKYGVYSTNANYFQNNNTYVGNDYRNVLQRKGYTFYGWYLTNEAALLAGKGDGSINQNNAADVAVTTPQYEDIDVFAAWHANSYDLTLNAFDHNATSMYQYNEFKYTYESIPPTVQVVVDEELVHNGNSVNIEDWPDRAQESENWYVYNKNSGSAESQENKRFLLGFTFAALDPGSTKGDGYSTYLQYAGQVTQLYNTDTLLVKGQSNFFLPEEYGFAGIPDYPSGSTIEMYAVYRERSLVFIEYYNDIDGTIKQIEKAAYPYQEFKNYPALYNSETSKTEIENKGYSLIGWYFKEPTANASRSYPNDASIYANNLATYMANAGSEYDIRVYTVYAAQVNQKDIVLSANENPTVMGSVYTYTYTLPGSMQSGTMNYKITNLPTNVNLVTDTYLDAHKYDASIANTTFALRVKLLAPDGEVKDDFFVTELTGDFDIQAVAKAGWMIQLDLYTSKVMSETINYTFDFSFNFNGDDLKQQWILFDDLEVGLVPSMYDVEYHLNLPEDASDLTINDLGSYDEAFTYTHKIGYGSPLYDQMPTILGYDNDGLWYQIDTNNTLGLGENFLFPVNESHNGKILVETDWNIISYLLNVDANTMAHWNVKYQPLNGILVEFTGTNSIDNVLVPYHSTIIFEKKTGDVTPVEFVEVDWLEKDTTTVVARKTLDFITDYEILLENYDLNAKYQTLRTLYLENDNITINEDYYQHLGDTIVWHGDYQILMDETNNIDNSSTANVLSLVGDLTNKQIELGNLNITSDNSISLNDNTKVNLLATSNNDDSKLELKNIYVPYTSEFNLSADDSGVIVLKPSVNFAGIGGIKNNPNSGEIILDNMEVDITLPVGSTSSGIGAGEVSSSGKDIVLTKCNIIFTQSQSASSRYSGAWLGGKDVETIKLEECTFNKTEESTLPYDSYAICAQNIELNRVQVGTLEAINNAIYAEKSMTTNESIVNILVESQITMIPFGTSLNGNMKISNSNIEVVKGNGLWPGFDEDILYTGMMMINDESSEITIANHRLLEVGNGDIVINVDSYTQNSISHEHSGNYILLGNKNIETSNLSVNDDVNIILDNQGNDVTLKMITFNANPTFIGSNDKTLNVNGNFNGNGNLTLNNIQIDAGNNDVGSLGAIDGTDAAVKVNILGNSHIIAQKVGALGLQNETFTNVSVDDLAVINATVVKDHYRLQYECDGYTAPNYTVFRTEQVEGGIEVACLGNVPAGPTPLGNFRAWYYRINDDIYALSEDSNTLPGYDGNDVLSSVMPTGLDSIDNPDGTITIILYADMEVTGSAYLEEGRIFVDSQISGIDTNITIPANASFTAKITIKGANIYGGHYEFGFLNTLPANIKLTLVVLEEGQNPTYYYYITDGTEKAISTSSFIKMGTSNVTADLPNKATMGPNKVDEMLLAFDFSGANSVSSNTVSVNFVAGSYSSDAATFSYQLTTVHDGSLTVTQTNSTTVAGEVNVVLPNNSVNEGKEYALLASIDKSLPYDVEAKLAENLGVVIDGTQILFTNITSGTYQYVINGLTGEFSLIWKLITIEDDNINVAGDLLLTSTPLLFNVLEEELPYFIYEISSIDGNNNSNVKNLEVSVTHTIVLTYQTNQDDIKVIAEKQQALLANFVLEEAITTTIDSSNKTITIVLPATLSKGVYRIGISLNGNNFNDNDNAYITYIVR